MGRGIHKQWEEYYDQPGKRAESSSSTKAYATDEGKRITHQLWQKAMGINYQNVSALLDNQSMVSASQVAGGPFHHHLEVNLAGLTQLGEYCPWPVMTDLLGGYTEIGEANEERASGIRVGLLTYNDPSKTYSMYLGSNFNEANQKRFGTPPGQVPGIMSDPQAYPNQPPQKARMVEKGQEEESTLNTPQLKIPCLEPKAPPMPLLPGTELKNDTPAYNNKYTIQMLDVLDNPYLSICGHYQLWTTQVPQGLIQPVPQPRGARPKEVVQPRSNEGIPSNQSEVSSMTNLIKSYKTAAPSVVTSVAPSVSQVGDTSIVEQRPNVYECHDRRYTKRNHQQEPTDSPVDATQKVSIHSTPEVITVKHSLAIQKFCL